MIVKCRECGHELSTEAAACPSCGCPQQPLTPGMKSGKLAKQPKSHVYGWVALISFLMSNFTPAIIAPLVVIAALVFTVLEIKQGSKTFGGIMFSLCALQAWFIADHFGGISSSLGLTNPKQIEEATASGYSSTNLNVPTAANEVVEQKCREEWPNDFRMRVYCQNQQHEGIAALSAGEPTGVSHDAFVIIRSKCADEWPRDFKMRAYCETQQYESYRALQATTADAPGSGRCAQQWPDDYRMRQYCEQHR